MRLLGIVCVLLIHSSRCVLGQQSQAAFTQRELQLLARLNLCVHFGGRCAPDCPNQVIRHHWGVPICPLGLDCCSNRPQTATSDESPDSTVPRTTTTTTPLPPHSGTCGHVDSSSQRRKRIVGGRVASPGSHPWLVGFRLFIGAHMCSGALIAQQWVLTAAHCFKFFTSPAAWRVRLGEYDLLGRDEGERQVVIDRIILHPGYSARTASSDNNRNKTLYARYVHDIALVKLSAPAEVEPICLPSNQNPASQHLRQSRRRRHDWDRHSPRSYLDSVIEAHKRILTTNTDDVDVMSTNYRDNAAAASGQSASTCWVAGWGATLDATINDQLLREVTGEVMDSQVCSDLWGTRLESDMMCFGNGTYGPCAGDSGGPLSCQTDQGNFYLEGVVSWGTEDCNVSGYPSVFTRVEPYLDWIRQHMET